MTDSCPAELDAAISEQLNSLPKEILARSGSPFHSGLHAFTGNKPLYLLGLNPGGCPTKQANNTIAKQIAERRADPEPWSAYADECWNNKETRGTSGMQPRVLYLLNGLEMKPHHVPASNVVFVRTRNEADLNKEKVALLKICWPFHKAVIETLDTKVILCYGQTAGRWVREQLGVAAHIDTQRERNKRGWPFHSHRTLCGRIVVTATHPSRANWTNPDCDPTDFVRKALTAVK